MAVTKARQSGGPSAKLKHLLRKTAARTKDAVYAAIKTLPGSCSPEECANYLQKSGYDGPKIIPF